MIQDEMGIALDVFYAGQRGREMEETEKIQVKHLWEVEALSMRQIAAKLNLSRKKISRLVREEKMVKPAFSSILKPYGAADCGMVEGISIAKGAPGI